MNKNYWLNDMLLDLIQLNLYPDHHMNNNMRMILEQKMMMVDQDHDYHVLIDQDENDEIVQMLERFHEHVKFDIVV